MKEEKETLRERETEQKENGEKAGERRAGELIKDETRNCRKKTRQEENAS